MSYSDSDVGFAIGLTVGAGLSTLIGASLSFCVDKQYTDILPISLAFSAGVMIHVSFVEILSESLVAFQQELDDNDMYLSHIYSSLSFFGGIIIGYILDFIVHRLGYNHSLIEPVQSDKGEPIPTTSSTNIHYETTTTTATTPDIEHSESSTLRNNNEMFDDDDDDDEEIENKQLIKTSLITAIAIGLHNFPEGLATFVSALVDPTLGITIAIAIVIHNIPEGVTVAVPVYFATGSKYKALFWSFISGIAEPIGGLVGYGIINCMFNDSVFGVLFGFTAGIMIYISFKELLPIARKRDKNDKYSTILLFVGFLVMDISLILFECAV